MKHAINTVHVSVTVCLLLLIVAISHLSAAAPLGHVSEGDIEIKSTAGRVVILAGGSKIVVRPNGTINIEGKTVNIKSKGMLNLSGGSVHINSSSIIRLNTPNKVVIDAGAVVDIDGGIITLN